MPNDLPWRYPGIVEEIENVLHEKVHYTTEEFDEFVHSFIQKSGEYMWGWIFKGVG